VKLREIERLRAIAALMVVFTHTGPSLGSLGAIFGHPRTGVDLFFVISGFVVTRSLVRLLPDVTKMEGVDTAYDASRRGLRIFYTRRFFRIFPLAVFVVVLQGLFHWLDMPASVLAGDLNGYWREVFAIFTGVYNYAMPNEGYSQFGVYWSLSVEEHFYLLLPMSFLFVRTRARRIGLAVFGIAFVALVCRNYLDTPAAGTASVEYYRIFSSHLRFDTLLAGVAMAMLFDAPPSKPLLPPAFLKWIVLPACLAMVCAIPRVLPANTYFHQGFTATWFLCAILVAYASFDRGYVFEIPVLGRVLEYLGGRSYALYLLHFPMMRLDGALGHYKPAYGQFAEHNPWSHWAAYLLAVVGVSELTWRLLEWPMQRLGRRLTTREASTPAEAGAAA
jgi:peptidoglycan/LPS O-acetylase OafA/YrhL